MKYASNQGFEFQSPFAAFMIGLMQFLGGLGAEVTCILHLSRFDDPILTICNYIALASIARVDDIIFLSLSKAKYNFTKPSSPLQILMKKRDWSDLRSQGGINMTSSGNSLSEAEYRRVAKSGASWRRRL